MDGKSHDIPPPVENTLRSVSVMNIDIQNSDPFMLRAEKLGRNCRIVQETKSAGHVGIGMMPRRTAKGICTLRALQKKSGSRHRRIR